MNLGKDSKEQISNMLSYMAFGSQQTCPSILSVSKAVMAIIVSESSLQGAHTLKRL